MLGDGKVFEVTTQSYTLKNKVVNFPHSNFGIIFFWKTENKKLFVLSHPLHFSRWSCLMTYVGPSNIWGLLDMATN